jgi:hypothetical protein
MRISCRISLIKHLYFIGILCFISMITLLFVFKDPVHIVSICIICLFSAASCCIAISYSLMGWILYGSDLLYSIEMVKTPCCCRSRGYMLMSFFTLLISSIAFIVFVDFKIYDHLIAPVTFISIPWLAICLTLIVVQSIILNYYSFLKADLTPCDYTDFFDCKYLVGLNIFIVWDRCLYFVLELLTSLILDNILFKKTDWFFILIPACLAFITRVVLDVSYENDLYETKGR